MSRTKHSRRPRGENKHWCRGCDAVKIHEGIVCKECLGWMIENTAKKYAKALRDLSET